MQSDRGGSMDGSSMSIGPPVRPAMSAEVRSPVGDTADAPAVPTAALVHETEASQVQTCL